MVAATAPRAYLRNRSYLSTLFVHFFGDTMNNGRSVLVAWLALALGLSNEAVGVWLILYNVGAALTQPFFGWLSDRIGPRWIMTFGIGWLVFFYAIASLSGPWTALVATTIASIGSGAFHPAGTLIASQTSKTARTQATAVFFMLGQLGLFIGPIFAGLLLDRFGRIGFLALPSLALIGVATSYAWAADITRPAPTASQATQPSQLTLPVAAALVLLMLSINTLSMTAMTFSPKLFSELGYSNGYAGATAGLWMLGSAMGGIVGGHLADRTGNRMPLLVGFLGVIAPFYFFIPAPDTVRLVLLVVAGFFGGFPHSVLILLAQGLLPKRKALASGLSLGLMFMGGALGSYVVGLVADRVGLEAAMQNLAWLPLLLVGLVFVLPVRNAAEQ